MTNNYWKHAYLVKYFFSINGQNTKFWPMVIADAACDFTQHALECDSHHIGPNIRGLVYFPGNELFLWSPYRPAIFLQHSTS